VLRHAFEHAALSAREHGFPVITSSLGISRWKTMARSTTAATVRRHLTRGLVYRGYNWRKAGAVRMVEIGTSASTSRNTAAASIRCATATGVAACRGARGSSWGCPYYGDDMPKD